MLKSFFKIISLFFLVFCFSKVYTQEKLEGTWQVTQGSLVESLTFVDGYLSYIVFDIENKEFITTRGGKYKFDENQLSIIWQFDTEKTSKQVTLDQWLGQEESFEVSINSEHLKTDFSEQNYNWVKQDDAQGGLSGVWRMSGRKQAEELSTTPLRDRRTLKILTASRFQWVAINIKTGEFFGTGGGSYTFENGRYTEHIEFFSRNSSRVGAVLSFQGEIKDGQWHHFGNSSSGNFIYEIWEKLKP